MHSYIKIIETNPAANQLKTNYANSTTSVPWHSYHFIATPFPLPSANLDQWPHLPPARGTLGRWKSWFWEFENLPNPNTNSEIQNPNPIDPMFLPLKSLAALPWLSCAKTALAASNKAHITHALVCGKSGSNLGIEQTNQDSFEKTNFYQ